MRTWMMAVATLALASSGALAQTAPAPAPMAHGEHAKFRHHGHMMDGMSTEGKKLVAVEMIDGREKSKGFHDSRKAARERVRSAMLAEPYNANALRDAFEAERKLAGDQMKVHHDHMVQILGKLSPADRKIFAEGMGKMEHRGMKFRDRMKDHQGRGDDMPPRSN